MRKILNYSKCFSKSASPTLLGFLNFFSIFFFQTLGERNEETDWYIGKNAGGQELANWISGLRTVTNL